MLARHLVPKRLRYPVIKVASVLYPRILPLEYLGVAADRAYSAERITDIIEGVNYAGVYDRYLSDWRRHRFSMLEIGVWRGQSLRMWKNYFPRATVAGLDIDPAAAERAEGFTVFVGSQDDTELLDRAVRELPDLRLLVDDGSHINELTIATFEYLFPRLPSGGLYLIEDMGVSYEDGPLAPSTSDDWPGMERNRPASHRRADIDALLLRLTRDCDLGGSRREVAFVHIWPMCVVIGRA